MNSDFRVAVSLPSHPKALKLMRRCGDIAFYNLVKFWAFVAQNKPNGILKGLDQDDIEIASGWVGQCSEFYQALLDLHFIDDVDGVLVVHDWEDHNGYACHAEERSNKAKNAAKARWTKKNNATSIDQALLSDATSNAPSPTPSPILNKNLSSSGDEVDGVDFLLTKKKRKMNGKRFKSFLVFWDAFDYKKGKREAADAWYDIPSLNQSLVDKIVAAAKLESEHRKELVAKGGIPKMAQGWINGFRWEDDIKTNKPEIISVPIPDKIWKKNTAY